MRTNAIHFLRSNTATLRIAADFSIIVPETSHAYPEPAAACVRAFGGANTVVSIRCRNSSDNAGPLTHYSISLTTMSFGPNHARQDSPFSCGGYRQARPIQNCPSKTMPTFRAKSGFFPHFCHSQIIKITSKMLNDPNADNEFGRLGQFMGF